jgi:hypothetical protein|tara:strand:- start:3489 stop:3791 length:303 start_codon:yes stop_codon:yes gene_type:complete
MAQDPRKLRKLLDILTQFGVTKYESEELKIEIDAPVALAKRLYGAGEEPVVSVAKDGFSIDNYDKEGAVNVEGQQSSKLVDSPDGYLGYSDEEMLNWSAG